MDAVLSSDMYREFIKQYYYISCTIIVVGRDIHYLVPGISCRRFQYLSETHFLAFHFAEF